MSSFLTGLKTPCYFLLLVACFLISPAARAQRERVLQQVDLRLPGNQPLLADPYLLPGLVAQGIEAGKITPYHVDYETNSINPLSLAQYRKSLEFANFGDLFGGEEDTLLLFPSALYLLALDVTKEQGVLKKINYLHFSSMDHQAGFVKYHYSVSFPQLAAYLQETKALWVKNSSPLIWRSQVLHTHGKYPQDVLSQMPVSPAESEYLMLHLVENAKGKYEQLELYSREEKLVKRIPYLDLLPAKDSSGIRWLDEALQSGFYQVGFADPRDGDEAEKKLNTTLPEAPQAAAIKPAPVAFSIIQTDQINTLHPGNEMLKGRESELLSFINKAIAQGLLTHLYTSADLTGPITAADWQNRLRDSGEMPASPDTSHTGQVHFPPRILLSWKIFFNGQGEITGRQPLALGFQADSRHTATGFDYTIGYIPFEEAVKTLKERPAARLLAELKRRKYFAFWENSFAISAENPKGSARGRKK